MDMKQIKRIMTVARLGSFSAAAKEHAVTVQAVSKSVTDLERELGARLFLRKSHGVALTVFGQRFVLEAEKVLASFSELEDFVDGYIAGRIALEGLSLMVGVSNAQLVNGMCDRIARSIRDRLDIDAVVYPGDFEECLQELSKRQADGFITLGNVSRPNVRTLQIGVTEPVFIMSKSHPLAHQRSVSLRDAADYPVVMLKLFDCPHDALLEKYRGRLRFLALSEDAGATGLTPMRFASSGGLVLSVGVGDVANRLSTDFRIRPLAEADSMAVPVCLAMRNETPGGALARFVEFAKTPLSTQEFLGNLS